MIRQIAAIFAILALVTSAPAWAYGRYGHETVTRIALLNVKPATRAKVLAMLSRAALLETPGCEARTPADASVWPDCIRGMGLRFSYTAPWHYQNVDICRPFDLASACANGNCVSAQIDRNLRLLQDTSIPTREKVAALAFLIHFVGDLHMPLHAGDRRDRGGNDVRASYGDFTARWVNLHSIWDGPLAERALTTPPALERVYSAAERRDLGAGTTADWSRESWQVSRDVAYALAVGGDPCASRIERVRLSNEAIAKAVEPQRLQVTRAGLRLARLLDEAFDPAKTFDSRERRRR